MKADVKPYRLLNRSELAFFQQRFSQTIQAWNEKYSTQRLEVELLCAAKSPNQNEFSLLIQAEQPLVLLDKQYLTPLKKSLFADSSDCFSQVSEDLFIQLLRKLLAVESLALNSNFTCETEWFYSGSTCLHLLLKQANECFSLYLHPNWVLKELPQLGKRVKPLGNLDTALATKSLQLTVQLEPFQLSLHKLSQLRVGDVIKTEHLLTTPLLLQHRQEILCKADAGQLQEHKSIQLTRIL